MDNVTREIVDAAGKLGAGLLLKSLWDWFVARRKERNQDKLARSTAQTDYEKSVLSTAATMVEALMKDLREDVSRLREQVAALTQENERLKEENKLLKERIRNLEEHRS